MRTIFITLLSIFMLIFLFLDSSTAQDDWKLIKRLDGITNGPAVVEDVKIQIQKYRYRFYQIRITGKFKNTGKWPLQIVEVSVPLDSSFYKMGGCELEIEACFQKERRAILYKSASVASGQVVKFNWTCPIQNAQRCYDVFENIPYMDCRWSP